MSREKIFFVLVLLFSAAKSIPVDGGENFISIVKYENEPNIGDGTYKFAYETSDGTSRREQAKIKTDKDNNEYIVVSGSYSYIDPDGKLHIVSYSADENGFRQQVEKERPILRIGAATLGSLVGGGLG